MDMIPKGRISVFLCELPYRRCKYLAVTTSGAVDTCLCWEVSSPIFIRKIGE